MSEWTLSGIAAFLNAEWKGGGDEIITGIREIQHARTGDIAFIGNPAYEKFLEKTGASAVIVSPDLKTDFPNLIIVDDPQDAMAKLIPVFLKDRGLQAHERGIHKTAVIHETSLVGKNVHIGAYTVIGPHCVVGDDSTLMAHVILYDHVIIGKSCTIHAGTVIGSDGFGYTFKKGSFINIPQRGKVIIHNQVDIGANCTIDRGSLGDTVIGEGTKLDNQVMIAHNVKIGKHCVFAGMSGVAGSATIGDYCVFGGRVSVNGHVHVADGTQVAAMSGVSKNTKPGEVISGYFARPIHDFRREQVWIRKLPEMGETLKRIKKILKLDEES
ncbi:MAG TPA: UDP-3-O-(3-hydroxymyristoyl)glucosamine N-acyltransferase [Candidatus Marinimicrobia bacterium]|nr:UDP-3-O-(3-hydroxymyristoyl)glucosamine N-acyltransferase [Candidatus Neomarinimicrobiota bacterium]